LDELPAELLATVPEESRAAVLAWWAGLQPVAREEVAGLCDERWEACFFGPSADDPPSVVGGRFLAPDDAWLFAAWEDDWREYLVEHPDVVLASTFRSRSFRDGDGIVNVLVDWSRTRFSVPELPPSEHRPAEPRALPDRC
jgi:hypothetical protein